jgi:hypothetical protein
MRDEHLRADNVFAAARFPTVEFRSTVLVETPTGLNVTGTLRVRDIGHLPRDTVDHGGSTPLQRHAGRVTQGVRDHPTGHHQARQGHPRHHPGAGLTGAESVRLAMDLHGMVTSLIAESAHRRGRRSPSLSPGPCRVDGPAAPGIGSIAFRAAM